MHDDAPKKPAVSISEMASMCGLSYQRFAQLKRQGFFPSPLKDEETNRPYYDEELQSICLLARRRNTGINGKTVMFYSARSTAGAAPKRKRTSKKKPQVSEHLAHLVEAVKGLGLDGATPKQVEVAVKKLYPGGTDDVPEMEIVRSVFVHLMQKHSTR